MPRLMAIAVIPARLDSTRFPGKVLFPLLNKPMVQWVYENVREAKNLVEVVVASDHADVVAAVEKFGGKAVLTPKGFETGTDRVAWTVQKLAEKRLCDIVVNVQGDEPLLPGEAVDRLVEALEQQPKWDIATLAVPLSGEGLRNPNQVKVVTSSSGKALYFSRQALVSGPEEKFLKHIGIYAYRREALFKLTKLPVSVLERCERLEQLRALENDLTIGVVRLENDTAAVDVPEDVKIVEERLMRWRFHLAKT